MFISCLNNQKSIDTKIKLRGFSAKKDLLTVIGIFNYRFNSTEWKMIREEAAQYYLLRKARRLATSWLWIRRSYAARCFAVCPLPEDEKRICSLIDDPVFLVRSMASIAAIGLESRQGVMQTLAQMAKATSYFRLFYRDAFLQGSKQVFNWIQEAVLSEKDPNIHLACLEILSGITTAIPLSFLKQDLESKQFEVRLAALKVLVRNPQEASSTMLIEYLKDPKEEIRAAAALCLENFPTKKTLEELEKALCDESWQVRLNAAKSLKMMGEEGLEILKGQKEKVAYDTAQYVLQFS